MFWVIFLFLFIPSISLRCEWMGKDLGTALGFSLDFSSSLLVVFFFFCCCYLLPTQMFSPQPEPNKKTHQPCDEVDGLHVVLCVG